MKYMDGEQELLGIVETLKAFENILMGQKLIIYTSKSLESPIQ